jgi:uncharacterized protein (DUF849 family)
VSDAVVIACAVTGGMTVPGQSEAIPVTPEEIVASAVEAHAAGAAVIHVHVRDPQTGAPSRDVDLFAAVLVDIAARCDAVVQPTTGGGKGMTIAERARILDRFRPETASFNAGSINFGVFGVLDRRPERFQDWEVEFLASTRDYVFRNTFADMELLLERFRAVGARPECEAYDVGHLYNLRHLLDRGLLEPPIHVQFVLGVLGANGASVEQVVHMHRTARDLFGDGFTWSVAGVGYPGEFHVAATSLMLGGHVRVGLEDNLRLSRTRRAASNAELVEKAVALADLLDRRPASADEARALLGLKGRELVGAR